MKRFRIVTPTIEKVRDGTREITRLIETQNRVDDVSKLSWEVFGRLNNLSDPEGSGELTYDLFENSPLTVSNTRNAAQEIAGLILHRKLHKEVSRLSWFVLSCLQYISDPRDSDGSTDETYLENDI